jgi:ferredoxin
VARLLCAGGADVAPPLADYRGLGTCKAAAAVAGGAKSCPWGCLGLGDCAVACTFDAITMSATGLPVVLPARCTACGDCVRACPKDLFVVMPASQRLIVQCKSQLEGDAAERACRVACTACGKCVVDAAPGLIEIRQGLAVIDYAKNALAGPEAIRRCPTGAIAWVQGAQFSARPPVREGVTV